MKSVGDKRPSNEIKLYRDEAGFFSMRDGDGHEFGVPAEFDPNWGTFSINIRKEILQHMLNEGHTKIEFIDALCPFIARGGVGQYIAMPMCMKPQAEPEQVAVQTEQPAVQPMSEPSEQKTVNPPTIINTTSNQEKSTMIDTNTITHVVSAPVQTSAPNSKSESKLNPMDELTASIEAFKAKLKDMLEEATNLSRRSREVSIAQKQKEREYAQTKKTIEKIRVASGF